MLALDVQLQRGNFDLQARFNLEKPVTGLFGSSGSGKSTLLNLVAGLAHPDQGWLKLGDKHLFHSYKKINLPPDQRKVGVVFQDSQLFPHLAIQQNLLYGFKRTPRNQRRFNLNEIVDMLEIGHLLKKRPHQLSGGEKQRVGLGRALLASPEFLLLDEPMASLDQGLKGQILPFLKRVKDDLHLPMVYISHSMEEILYLTDHLVVINKGRILGTGHFRDMISAESISGVTRTMGLDNILLINIQQLDSSSGNTIASYQNQQLILPFDNRFQPGNTCYINIRSNEIALAKQRIPHISIQNQLQGQVVSLTENTSCINVEVNIGSSTPLMVDISKNAYIDLGLKPNENIVCLIKSQSFEYLGKLEK